jgi:hypothetical protein
MELLTSSDWDAFERLATQVGVAAERVKQARRRGTAADGARDSSTLLAGRPNGGVELLLARWISPDATDACTAAAPAPLIISRRAEAVQPALGSWPVWKDAPVGDEHLIVQRADGPLSPLLIGQLSSLAGLDQFVLVTRLGQPLHPHEQALARALAPFVPVVRVVAVAVPGEEPTRDDIASFSRFALSHMRDAGFGEGRCLSAGVWFTEAAARAPGTVQDLAQFIALDRTAVRHARAPMARRQLCSLLHEISIAAGKLKVPPPASPEDVQTLTAKLPIYLTSLGRELARAANANQRIYDDRSLREYFLERIQGWAAFTEPEGMWLRHVESLRTGAAAALLHEAQNAALLLRFDSFHEPPPVPAAAAPVTIANPYHPLVERLLEECKYMAAGFVLGVIAYLLVAQFPLGLGKFPAYLALALAAVLGYGAARRWLRRSPPPVRAAEQTQLQPPTPARPSAANDWVLVERKLLTWFNHFFSDCPVSPLDECLRLSKQLRCEET